MYRYALVVVAALATADSMEEQAPRTGRLSASRA